MKRPSITRLRRLVRLTEQLYLQRAQAAAELGQTHAELIDSQEVTRRYLDGENIVASAFPTLLATRAAKLGKRIEEVSAELDTRIDAAATAKASVKGVENKLQQEITRELQERSAQDLEDVIDRFVRENSDKPAISPKG